MDSRESDRIRELSSRLIEVLRLLATLAADGVFGARSLALADRLEAVRQYADDPGVQRHVWPEIHGELFPLLDTLTRAGIHPSESGYIAGALRGTALDFFTPPSLQGVGGAIAEVASELDHLIRIADEEAPEASAHYGEDYPAAPAAEAPGGGSGAFAEEFQIESADEDSGGYAEAYPAEAAADETPPPAESEPSAVAQPEPEPLPEPPPPPPTPDHKPVSLPPDTSTESFADRGLDPAITRSAPTTAPSPAEPPPSKRVVNTGFCDYEEPESESDVHQPLNPDTPYWYWVEIGPIQRHSIEDVPTALPSSLPANARLTVAVFSFPDELILTTGADVGAVQLTGSVESEVLRQPGNFDDLFGDNAIRKRRLFFPVTTPLTPGRYRMRCNIYYEHVLLQSRIIAAYVAQTPPQNDRALRSTIDFKLSHTLDPARLSRMAPQTLSVFINDNPGDTHGFYFEGEQQLKTQSLPDGQQLQDSLNQTRETLRSIAWGSPKPFESSSFAYRYSSPGEPDFFTRDLIALAIRGYMTYNSLIDKMSGGYEASQKLADMMLKPGRVQISSKESARMVVPAAMFYDYPLDTQWTGGHRVCDAFLKAVRAHQDLEGSPCFNGACPHMDELDVVCPGGFWGYRHEVGLPVSIEQAGTGDAETEIQFEDPASMVAIVSMDPMFQKRETHESQLKLIRTPLGFTLCETRSTAVTALKQQGAQLVYFYCHGGVTGTNVPFLSIGDKEAFTPDNLRPYNIRWKAPRPLVFINGCMTTALEPERAIDFVSFFVNNAAASGVIGTEITVFEPLATEFAQVFLKYFMGECKSLGQSVKLARLALLQQFNPLGLVYIPFALPGLRMVDLATVKTAAANS
jgi:hypothetical protein